VSDSTEVQSHTEQVEPLAASKQSSRKSVLALSVFALGLNATAAVYTTSPSDFALPNISIPLPNVSSLAELLPYQRAPEPTVPDPVVVALKDIQSAQQQHAASLLESNSALLQHTAQLQHDSTTLLGLRQSVTDEQADIKKISSQLSTLMVKVDALQNAIAPDITSSIGKGRARNRLSALARKRLARQSKPLGPVSVGGAPLTIAPAQVSGTVQSPEG
jgi:uncharacterized coiled-coil protein SlyX